MGNEHNGTRAMADKRQEELDRWKEEAVSMHKRLDIIVSEWGFGKKIKRNL